MHAFRLLAKATAVTMSAAVLFGVGCKHKHTSEEATSKIAFTPRYASAPTNFIAQIARTDHVVIAYRFPDPFLRGYELKLSGDNMNRLLLGITSLERLQWSSDSIYAAEIRFYHGPDILAKACFQDDLVLIGTAEYRDRSGQTHGIYGMLEEESNRWRHDHQ